MRRALLASSSCGVLLATLTLGLWPFHAPRNDVSRLPTGRGLHFGKFANAVSLKSFSFPTRSSGSAASIEIWLRPATIWQSHTILASFSPGHPYQFSLHQRQMGLEIQTEQSRHGSAPSILAERVFRQPGQVFVVVTLSPQVTAVYVDGVLAKFFPAAQLSASYLTGNLLLADSPGQPDSWPGDVLGLAFYSRQLTASEVFRDYKAWIASHGLETSVDKTTLALYLFNEREGETVRNRFVAGPNLYISKNYHVAERVFLESPWSEFDMSLAYWEAVLKNVAGFLPFGFCFCAYFTASGRTSRPGVITVVFGLFTSLTIEVLQGFLPTRDSGMTDVVTNTFGTWVGVSLYTAAARAVALFRQPSGAASTFRTNVPGASV